MELNHDDFHGRMLCGRVRNTQRVRAITKIIMPRPDQQFCVVKIIFRKSGNHKGIRGLQGIIDVEDHATVRMKEIRAV